MSRAGLSFCQLSAFCVNGVHNWHDNCITAVNDLSEIAYSSISTASLVLCNLGTSTDTSM